LVADKGENKSGPPGKFRCRRLNKGDEILSPTISSRVITGNHDYNFRQLRLQVCWQGGDGGVIAAQPIGHHPQVFGLEQHTALLLKKEKGAG
jgi:hypothetical protein